MTLRRDTYHDYVTDAEFEDMIFRLFWLTFPNARQMQEVFSRRMEPLRKRSGFHQVTNSIEITHKDIQHMATVVEIRFDSAAWTGR